MLWWAWGGAGGVRLVLWWAWGGAGGVRLVLWWAWGAAGGLGRRRRGPEWFGR